ncbi:MAG: tetratricopeptide repeat protein [Candidatus Omnitrophica bacterium]|nr:tetratricopeptide repeat protein [Candidatus Omnitrophota bacterium]MCB9722337.1 tetratricopeptide repeat protein [Candidatus Omnitrophota bacterium]
MMFPSKTMLLALCLLLLWEAPSWANPVKEKYEAATVAFSRGKYDQAIALYEEVIDLYPGLPQAYYYLGMAHRQKGTRPKDTLWLFEKALEIDPGYAEAHETLSKMYYELGEFDPALKHGLEVLKVQPDNVNAKLSVGWTYLLGQSNPHAAIPYFQEVLEVQEVPYAYLGLGMSYFMTDQRARVLDVITRLRSAGEEDLAAKLEGMIRDSRFDQEFRTGQPLFAGAQAPAKPSTIVKNKSPHYPTLTGNKAVENMPVRLSGSLPGTRPRAADNDDLSAQERIRDMQRRSQRYSKGSGY